MAQKYGLRVLAVNVNYGIKTKIGRENLSVIPKMGASLIEFTPEYNVHKNLIRIGLEEFGDPDLTSHGLLYSYPHWVAVMYDIPLILWGENSAFEYGGDEESIKKFNLDKKWFLRYVMTKQITVEYLSENYNIPLEKLKFYNLPDEIMKEKGMTSTFLGVYFLWDSEQHLKIAKTYGFKSLDRPREGTFRNYVGIDEKINRIHQFMKVLKFGYGRATDHACEEIRNGRMSRDEAIELIKKYDTQALSDYYVDDFCKFMGYTKDEFWNIMDKYCNKDICTINKDHSLTIKGHKEL
jgi:N-acetyl sugar amidotransferase